VKFKNHTYDILGVLTITLSKGSRLNTYKKGVRGVGMTGGSGSGSGSGGGGGGGGGGARHRSTVGSATVGSVKASDVMPNGRTRDGCTVKPARPKFKTGDKVVLNRFVASPCMVYKVLRVLDTTPYAYEIIHPVTPYAINVVDEKDISPVKNTTTITTMSVTNSTGESINLYYMPEGKSVYKDPLSDFKPMGSIGPGETMGLKTKIGDSFACTTMESIIKVFKVSETKEKITIKFD